jgi:methionyl-tRNA formyltransferase
MAISKLKVIFAGTPEFSAFFLEVLLKSEHQVLAVYTQPDRVAGRGRVLSMSPVKKLALKHHIPVNQPRRLQDDVERLKDYQADIMIVVAYGLILKPVVLELFPLGCVNVHASSLSRWRGAAPIQRAILAGDEHTGVSIMQMDQGLDTGDILAQVDCAIEPTDTSQILHDRLAILGSELLLQTLPKIQTKSIQPIKQDETKSCYAEKIEKSEARIDWRQSIQSIERKIRAFNPWPVAFTSANQVTVRIWQAQITELDPGNHIPGTILDTTKKGIDVAANGGVLRLLTIQLPGGRALPVSAVLNAKATLFSPGSVFE